MFKKLDKIMEFSLYGFILTLPFSKTMLELFFIFALASWALKRIISYSHQPPFNGYQLIPLKEKIQALVKMFKPVNTELNGPISIFIFIGFLSTITSVSFYLSLEGFFFKLFEWIMLYFIVTEALNSKEKLYKILGILFFSMVIIGIDGIFQAATGVDFIRRHPMSGVRLKASFSSPNSFAGWLVMMIPLALSFAYFWKDNLFKLSSRHNWLKKAIRPGLWAITGILTFCLAFTYSRGAWIGVILAVLFIGRLRSRKLLIMTVIAILILPLFMTGYLKERTIAIIKFSETAGVRPLIWEEAVNIVKDFPFLGCGLNTYAIVGPHYKVPGGTGYYPHNSYLHMAAESGLLGLASFLWIIAALFKTSLANLKRIGNGFYSIFLTGLLAGLFGFLAHSFVDTNIYTLQLGNLMWFIMGLMAAVQRTAGFSESGDGEPAHSLTG